MPANGKVAGKATQVGGTACAKVLVQETGFREQRETAQPLFREWQEMMCGEVSKTRIMVSVVGVEGDLARDLDFI